MIALLVDQDFHEPIVDGLARRHAALEKGDVETVAGEFRRFLEAAVDSDGNRQRIIQEMRRPKLRIEANMKTMTLSTTISERGMLDLHLPCNLPPGPVEVVVVVQPIPTATAGIALSLSGKFADSVRDDKDVLAYLRQLRRETTEASWEFLE